MKKAPLPAGLYINYKVQRGNRLDDITGWFNVSRKALFAWNPKLPKSGMIQTGQVLKIRGLPRELRKTKHRVTKGESLWTIAGLYGIDSRRLAAWNGVRKGVIHPGRKLVVYHLEPKRTAQANSKLHKVSYRVRKGNYLAAIADLFGVSIRQIKKWNRLAGGRINAGQTLVLHLPKKVKKADYRVRPGDTLSEIAQRLRVKTSALRLINGIRNPAALRAGQAIIYYSNLG